VRGKIDAGDSPQYPFGMNGYPTSSNEEPTHRHVQVRLSATMAAELERAAAETTGTTSSYVRRAIFDQLERDGFRNQHEERPARERSTR
jgi:hypothetical protein